MGIEKSMSESEAHEEANIMKALINLERNPQSIKPKWLETMLGESEETQKLLNKYIEHSATPKEYDEVLEKIENLKKLVEEEPTTAKVLYAIGRILKGAGNFLLYSILKDSAQLIGGNEGKESIIALNQRLNEKLDDTSAELRRAREAGERYGKAELDR